MNNNTTIGFSNFRRFIDFPEMTLGGITILVGANNAGKSTLVKALLLMRDFLKSRIEGVDNSKFFGPLFRFDTEHVNVGEFYRAFCRQSPKEADTITFKMALGKYRFSVDIKGERKTGIIPQVSKIVVSDDDKSASFVFDFMGRQMSVFFGINEAKNNYLHEWMSIVAEISELKSKLVGNDNLDEISKLNFEIKQREKKADSLTVQNDLGGEGIVTAEMVSFTKDRIGNLLIPELIKNFARYAESGTIGDKKSETYKIQEANKIFLRGKAAIIKSIADEIETEINKQTIEYIYAHSVNQNALYANCANSEDYTKRTVHEFYMSRISPGDTEFKIITDWLEKFKIGKFLEVKSYAGDSYRIYLYDEIPPNDEEIKKQIRMDLTDKGMGSMQLVILLLRLATLVRKFQSQQLTILLEEPEQNLHPAIQSKLADLLYNINKEFGVRFVIETHSEYLVRKTQIIVAEEYNNSLDYIPFKIYYLPSDEKLPYEMQYRSDGKFSNEFGEGFFDEAASLAFKIF